MAETGVLSGLYLRVGNQLIANWTYDNVKSAYVTLNSSQLYALSYAASTASSVGFLGANFVQSGFRSHRNRWYENGRLIDSLRCVNVS